MYLVKTIQFVLTVKLSFGWGENEFILTGAFKEDKNKLRKAFETFRNT